MNEYKKIIRKLHKGEIVDLLERKKIQLHNLEGTLNFLKLNPKYDNGSNERSIERLKNEIDALNEAYSEDKGWIQVTKKVYLHEIIAHYFDVMDLNYDKWTKDDNGYYTVDPQEVAWFKMLEEAYSNIPEKELKENFFGEYDDIIDYYSGKKGEC